MLWLALHFPQLRQQALARGHVPPEPERQALAAAAAWACGFTPRVSLEPPEGLLLEVEGSLRCLGGEKKFFEKLQAGLIDLGLKADAACAPTARAALWRAAGGGGALEALPVEVTGLAPEALGLLAALGIRTLGGLTQLPREGIAPRFGQDLPGQLDQALGRSPEPREFFVPPARFAERLELPAPVTEAGSALFAARRLLAQLEGALAARHAGVRRFRLVLLHPGASPTALEVGLAAPARDAGHFAQLLRERLARIELAAPVEAIRVEAGDFEPLAQESGRLFDGPDGGGEAWLRLIERLQARLGSGAVHGLDLHDEHRPERAFHLVLLGKENSRSMERKKDILAPRPLWLLEPPRRLEEGGFALLAGPERIESGWWDAEEARRDYFIARIGEGSLAWVYRERQGGWFVHGFFA